MGVKQNAIITPPGTVCIFSAGAPASNAKPAGPSPSHTPVRFASISLVITRCPSSSFVGADPCQYPFLFGPFIVNLFSFSYLTSGGQPHPKAKPCPTPADQAEYRVRQHKFRHCLISPNSTASLYRNSSTNRLRSSSRACTARATLAAKSFPRCSAANSARLRSHHSGGG